MRTKMNQEESRTCDLCNIEKDISCFKSHHHDNDFEEWTTYDNNCNSCSGKKRCSICKTVKPKTSFKFMMIVCSVMPRK